MDEIVSKRHQFNQQDTYITYNVSELDNYNSVISIYNDLKGKGIKINQIIVNVASDNGILVEDKMVFKSLQEYQSAYNKLFTDNLIYGISLSCVHDNLRFNVDINSKLKKVFTVVFGLKSENEFNLDGVVLNAINHRRK